jgi:hypothetical protein
MIHASVECGLSQGQACGEVPTNVQLARDYQRLRERSRASPLFHGTAGDTFGQPSFCGASKTAKNFWYRDCSVGDEKRAKRNATQAKKPTAEEFSVLASDREEDSAEKTKIRRKTYLELLSKHLAARTAP